MHIINPLCRPSESPECRKTCARYRGDPQPHGQSYVDLYTGDGIRCYRRLDVNNFPVNKLSDWRDIDAQALTQIDRKTR